MTNVVHFIPTDLNLTISRQTISRILHNFDVISYIAPKNPRITREQRRTRADCCYEHLSWSVNHWSKNENSYEILESNIYICRLRHDPTRIQRSSQHIHRREGLLMSYTNSSILA